MMLGSLTHTSLMDMCWSITPPTWRQTCGSFLQSRNSKVIFYFLTILGECFCLEHILFCLLHAWYVAG